ncbi:MAG: AAA family ATPase [Acidiferrobacterales bacterium]
MSVAGYTKIKPGIPPRHWGLVGPANAGKSTFLAAMRTPLLIADADHRFTEVANNGVDAYLISDSPAEMRDPAVITRILRERGAEGAGTVCVDSVTAIITPYVRLAMADNRAGKSKNKAAPFVEKSTAMALLQDAVIGTGCDAAFIWHVERAMDDKGVWSKHHTLPETERRRLMRSLNMVIELRNEGGQRSARITWSRKGPKDIVIVDEQGFWRGVPERIEEAVYGVAGAAKVGGAA